MALGATFALDEQQVAQLLALDDDDAREEFLEAIEDDVADENWCRLDKAWDALHRVLGDGELEIPEDPSAAPAEALAVFGSVALMSDEADLFAGLLPARDVPRVLAALDAIGEDDFRRRYAAIEGYAPEFGEVDLDYTLGCFEDLRVFYRRAAAARSALVFTVSG